MRDAYATSPLPASHVDLDEIRVISHALFCGAVSIQEARVAVGLLYSPEPTGLREIEILSGLSAHTLLKVLPQAGMSSDLLTCRTRGAFEWAPEDRRPMVFEHRSFLHHNQIISPKDLSSLRSEGGYREEDHGGADLTGVLDPSLDLWSNKTGKLGDAGWALAMVTLLDSMTFSMTDLGRILKLGERQVRRVIEGLGHLAVKTKVGRAVKVAVDMSWVKGWELTEGRKAARSRSHQEEASAVRAMATQVGRTAREMWKNRLAEIRHLREYLAEIPAMGALRHRVEHLIQILGGKRRWAGERALRKLMDPLSV